MVRFYPSEKNKYSIVVNHKTAITLRVLNRAEGYITFVDGAGRRYSRELRRSRELNTEYAVFPLIYNGYADNVHIYADRETSHVANKHHPNRIYEVDIYSKNGNTISAIDTITAPEGYTAEDYIVACNSNADDEWVKLINSGVITLREINN